MKLRVLALGLWIGWLPCLVLAQEPRPSDPLELSEAVFRLEQQLAGQSIPAREAAEKQLIAWGLPVLDHLSPLVSQQSADFQERLGRVRTELERLAIIAVTNPSQIRLEGELTLPEIAEQIFKQSGNRLIAEGVSAERADRKTNWTTGQPLDFWTIIRRLQVDYDLEVDPYSGQTQTLALTERREGVGARPETPAASAGLLNLELTRIDSTRNLKLPEMDRTVYGLVVNWEPRLRPISIDIPQSSLRITDEFDKLWKDESSSEIHYGMVQPEVPLLEFSLSQPLVDRQVEQIKSLAGVAVAVLPGRIENFVFSGIGGVPADTSQTKGGATVTYDGMLKLDDLFGARVALSFSEEQNALESHQSWAYQNECFLETKDGQRIDSIGSETYQQENARLGIMFLFPEYPADAKLIYRTPAAIVKVEIPFELKGIKLP